MPFVRVKTSSGVRALGFMRNRRLSSPRFRAHSDVLTQEIVTYVRDTRFIASDKSECTNVIGVFILRAGLAFFGAAVKEFPGMRFGFAGLRRHEKPGKGVTIERYYWNVPIDPTAVYYIFDPMLATGESMASVIESLVMAGVPAERICGVVTIAAPEALKLLHARRWGEHVVIYGAALDKKLDRNFYIVPGLGDYGDRYCGTSVAPARQNRSGKTRGRRFMGRGRSNGVGRHRAIEVGSAPDRATIEVVIPRRGSSGGRVAVRTRRRAAKR